MDTISSTIDASVNQDRQPFWDLEQRYRQAFGTHRTGRDALDDIELRCTEVWDVIDAAKEMVPIAGEAFTMRQIDQLLCMIRAAQALLGTIPAPLATAQAALLAAEKSAGSAKAA